MHKENRIFCLLLIFSSFYSFAEDKNFVVVIPSYNNKQWYEQNLGSVFMQQYKNYRIIYIDDASTDGTGHLVHKMTIKYKFDDTVVLICNQERKGALANLYYAIATCDPNEIIVMLDGDDWFAHDKVLNYLNRIYQDPNVWMTYGQLIEHPACKTRNVATINKFGLEINACRQLPYISSHPRTCYAWLFQLIKKEDLMHEGKFFPIVWDLAFMFPMIEMAGTHCKGIEDILYVYNTATQLSDNKTHSYEEIVKYEGIIRNKKAYPHINFK